MNNIHAAANWFISPLRRQKFERALVF